jgi:hypothetical protein
MAIDYKAVLTQALDEFGAVLKERQELDLKVAQKLQFIRATMNQLPDDEVSQFEDCLQKLASGSAGLSDSIRMVLQENLRKWHTAAQVRDALIKSGFDFGNYASNPLASVHSTLKRLKPEEAETHTVDGVMVWRWKATDKPRRRFRHRNPFGSNAGLGMGTLADLNKPTEFWSQIVKDMIAKEKK